MKVTPKNRRFGKYSPGEEFELPDKTAKLLILAGKLLPAPAMTYQTRMLTAQAPEPVRSADPVAFQKDLDPQAPVVVPVTPTEPLVVKANPAAVPLDLDSSGVEWDERLHVSTRLKNADGSWRKRPGARAAEE